MTSDKIDITTIPGYGMDADPENEPTYPMKNYTGDDHNRINYERSEQQLQFEEILQSNERPGLTAVFGTSVPPSGFSGAIRRYAFQHSEDRYRHWLPLLLADRINVFEGLIDDLYKGYVPNLFEERGWKVEMKHNARGFLSKMILTALITATIITVLTKKK